MSTRNKLILRETDVAFGHTANSHYFLVKQVFLRGAALGCTYNKASGILDGVRCCLCIACISPQSGQFLWCICCNRFVVALRPAAWCGCRCGGHIHWCAPVIRAGDCGITPWHRLLLGGRGCLEKAVAQVQAEIIS